MKKRPRAPARLIYGRGSNVGSGGESLIEMTETASKHSKEDQERWRDSKSDFNIVQKTAFERLPQEIIEQ